MQLLRLLNIQVFIVRDQIKTQPFLRREPDEVQVIDAAVQHGGIQRVQGNAGILFLLLRRAEGDQRFPDQLALLLKRFLQRFRVTDGTVAQLRIEIDLSIPEEEAGDDYFHHENRHREKGQRHGKGQKRRSRHKNRNIGSVRRRDSLKQVRCRPDLLKGVFQRKGSPRVMRALQQILRPVGMHQPAAVLHARPQQKAKAHEKRNDHQADIDNRIRINPAVIAVDPIADNDGRNPADQPHRVIIHPLGQLQLFIHMKEKHTQQDKPDKNHPMRIQLPNGFMLPDRAVYPSCQRQQHRNQQAILPYIKKNVQFLLHAFLPCLHPCFIITGTIIQALPFSFKPFIRQRKAVAGLSLLWYYSHRAYPNFIKKEGVPHE